VFNVVVDVADTQSNFGFAAYVITIDNAAGEARGVSLAPRIVTINYAIGSGTPAAIPVTINTTTGTPAYTLAVEGLPSVTVTPDNGAAPGSVNLNVNTASLNTPGTYVGVLGLASPSSASQLDSVPIVLTVTAGAPTVSLNGTTFAAGATITATIANGPGTAGDWVGLFATGDPDGTFQDWKYLGSGTKTKPGSGVTGGSVSFTAPATAGTYNVRFFLNDSLVKLATSVTITVQ
jgi:hypothetical protein